MRPLRTPIIGLVILCGLAVGTAQSQQIYRWTDADGKAHFGNQPPPDAKQVESRERPKTDAERECEAAADRQCRRDIKFLNTVFDDAVPTTVVRDCIAEYTANCSNLSKPKPQARKASVRHTLVTPRVKFDPAAGDQLVCRMKCGGKCTGSVEIWDLDSLARGENPGAVEYSVAYVPKAAGSAYCRATTMAPDSTIELTLARGGAVVARAQAQ